MHLTQPVDRRRSADRLALAAWCFLVWILLTWTATAEQLVFGLIVSVLAALALAPLGPVVGPWSLLRPRRLLAVVRLGGFALARIVAANLSLTRRIWSPARPLSSGMVIVPTQTESDGEVAATALITSLIVDNQLVDLDRRRAEFQYHVVSTPQGDAYDEINGPVERRVRAVRG